MRQIRSDLWETETFAPFPGLTTHAYLWRPASADNVLFYATGTGDSDEDRDPDGDLAAIEALGGIAHQYLSHQDEAGPGVAGMARWFGSQLHAPGAEVEAIRRFAEPDVLLDARHVDANGVEVIPTPGHSPGSTCFLVTGEGGLTYLFTGDTIFRDAGGAWTAGLVPGVSDPRRLASSLELLRTLEPDLVASSAFAGDVGAHLIEGTSWATCVDQALATLPRLATTT